MKRFEYFMNCKNQVTYVRAMQGHTSGSMISPEFMGQVEIPFNWKNVVFHTGCSLLGEFHPSTRTTSTILANEAIVVNGHVPANCIYRVSCLKGKQTLHEKVPIPRHAPKAILKSKWRVEQEQTLKTLVPMRGRIGKVPSEKDNMKIEILDDQCASVSWKQRADSTLTFLSLKLIFEFLQSGLDDKWLSDSMECYCYLRNNQDLLADGKTPLERKFGESFKGSIIPFGALWFFSQTPRETKREFINSKRKYCQESFLVLL